MAFYECSRPELEWLFRAYLQNKGATSSV